MVVWAEEITLEMLWAHATAPGAKILPVLAPKLATNDLYNTTNYVVNHNLADVISQSLGAAETCMDPTILASQHGPGARRATRTGVTDQAGYLMYRPVCYR